ncbi:MAG: hypothetical protein N2689_02655 [Verrucomicrobiae bacterium]|nr:hypothetical protein [Verrucomicrobiae bacterium]
MRRVTQPHLFGRPIAPRPLEDRLTLSPVDRVLRTRFAGNALAVEFGERDPPANWRQSALPSAAEEKDVVQG